MIQPLAKRINDLGWHVQLHLGVFNYLQSLHHLTKYLLHISPPPPDEYSLETFFIDFHWPSSFIPIDV